MKYPLRHCVGFRLRRLSRIADGHIRKFLGNHGITENQMTILFMLYEMGQIEQGKVGEALCLERSTVSRNIRLLEKQQLVQRTTDYRPKVEMTVLGLEMVKTIIPEWEKAMDLFMDSLEAEGMDSLKKLEDKMV